MFKTFKKDVMRGFTLLELIVVIVVLGILAALAIPTFGTVKEKSADSIALKNAQALQRDFDAQLALAASDSSISPSAAGTWSINGQTYSYTASSGATPVIGGNVSKSGGSGGSQLIADWTPTSTFVSTNGNYMAINGGMSPTKPSDYYIGQVIYVKSGLSRVYKGTLQSYMGMGYQFTPDTDMDVVDRDTNQSGTVVLTPYQP